VDTLATKAGDQDKELINGIVKGRFSGFLNTDIIL